jgi:DNA damage-binding protein 1
LLIEVCVQVAVYSYTYPATLAQAQIRRLVSYRAHSEPIDISVYGNTIAVGDLMKGPSMLEYNDEENELHEVSRIYHTSWSTAVEMLDAEAVVGADAEGNMSIWRRNVSGVTEDDRRRLQLIGDVKIGESVNRIRRGDQQSPISSYPVAN